MRQRFLDRGYSKKDLDDAFLQVDDINGMDMLQAKLPVQTESEFNHAFFTMYSTQHFGIKSILATRNPGCGLQRCPSIEAKHSPDCGRTPCKTSILSGP